jgi:hypothetical protein
VKVGENVHFRHSEIQATVGRVVVGAVLPGREDIFPVTRRPRFAVPANFLCQHRGHQQGADGGAE